MSQTDYVIVGGALAAATAAETLRAEGFEGRIRMICSEDHHPYIRPPLSKEYLTGAADLDTAYVHDEQWYLDNDIDLLLGRTARELDPGVHSIVLDDDSRMHYDAALLATGASPRRLSVDGSDAQGIHYLRTIESSQSLRDAISAGDKKIVTVGSGWIGLEVTAAARGYGNEVTVIGMETVPLSKALGDELGEVFGTLHREHGVNFRLPAGIKAFEQSNGRVTGVVIDGETIPADIVVVGVGAAPNVELAKNAGLTVENGVLTDERMRTSAADVFAAGDVANAFHPVVGTHMRNEHWANAIGGGRVAAQSMLGRDVVFDEIPYFYTDQYDLGMEYSGYPTLTTDAAVVYRGDLDGREFIAFWHVDGRVVAGMNVNIWDVNDQVQSLIRSGKVVDPGRLADAAVPVADL